MLPRVVWAEESKNGLRFKIGSSYDDVPTTSQCPTDAQSSCSAHLQNWLKHTGLIHSTNLVKLSLKLSISSAVHSSLLSLSSSPSRLYSPITVTTFNSYTCSPDLSTYPLYSVITSHIPSPPTYYKYVHRHIHILLGDSS